MSKARLFFCQKYIHDEQDTDKSWMIGLNLKAKK